MVEAISDELAQALGQMHGVYRDVVNWGKGSLLVLAGPGSGKTRALTCRIAKLLRDSSGKHFRILALTFTNKAADEMRGRVDQLAPGQDQRLFIGTFHSFCAEVLRQHGSHLGINPDFRIYAARADLDAILSDAVLALRPSYPQIRDADTRLLPVIERLKSKLIPPEDSARHVVSDDLKDRIEVVYRAYEDQLRELNALDFNSLVYYTHALFKKFPAFAKRRNLSIDLRQFAGQITDSPPVCGWAPAG